MNTQQTKKDSLHRCGVLQKTALAKELSSIANHKKMRNFLCLFLVLLLYNIGYTLQAQNVYYGMTSAGGNGAGRIFSYRPTSGLNTIFEFNGINGREPRGDLLQASNGNLYGMTFRGGSFGYGVLFSFNPSNNAYTILHSFQPSTGALPTGSLIEGEDGRLYGVTLLSGSSLNLGGVLFSFNLQNNQYQVLYEFSGSIQIPVGTPLQASNGKLYGLCVRTGNFGAGGGLYSYDISTNTFSVLRTFSDNSGGFSSTELYRGSLIQATNGKLYGTASKDADTGNQGSIFSYDIESNTFTRLHNFNGTSGRNPLSGVVQASNGKLYGLTVAGGSSDGGVLYSYNIDNQTFTVLTSLPSGSFPTGEPLEGHDGRLYYLTLGSSSLYAYNLTSNTNQYITSVTNNPYGSLMLYKNPSITTQTLSINAYCPDSNLEVNFQTTGNFAANNIFTAQLSDGMGSFSTPTNIGSIMLGGTNPAGVIQSTIPIGTVLGSGYRVRVVSSNPNILGTDNQADIYIGGSIQAVCKQYSTLLDASGTSTITVNDIDGGSTASCGIASMSLSQTTFDAVGTYTITLSVEDNLGNVATCEASVSILRQPKMYGVISNGGEENTGAIVEYDLQTNQISEILSLNAGRRHGARPEYTRLVEYQDKFYGMTAMGGPSNRGVIFEWNPSTNQYIPKIIFDGSNGNNPQGSLTFYNGKFYGMTKGTIFEWNPQTNEYITHFIFSNSVVQGSDIMGTLTLKDGVFYGMTYSGGSNNEGVIFEWNPSTLVYTKKIDLSTALGRRPYGDLTLEGGIFYGMTHQGGTNDRGVIFSWNPTDNTYIKLHDFNGVNGEYPHGSLTAHNGKLYGMTSEGGNYGVGTIFEWDIAGATYSLRKSMQSSISPNYTEGEVRPLGNLVWENGFFYGFTSEGGDQNEYTIQPTTQGIIFRWNPDNNDFVKLHDFNGFQYGGMFPKGSPTFKDGKMYGLTNTNFVSEISHGGEETGTIFEYNLSNNSYITRFYLNSLGNYQPIHPNTFTTQNGKFYGTTKIGQGAGALFEWNPVSNSIVRIVPFSELGMGMPQKPTLFRGKLVGSFAVPPRENPYTGVYLVNEPGNSNGENWFFEDYPGSSGDGYGVLTPKMSSYLTPKGDLLYGSIIYESAGLGRIISLDPVTQQVQEFYAFNQNAQGSYPVGPLILKNDKFYGVTQSGGANNQGVIFELDFNTKAYRKLHDFNNAGGNGRFPTDKLILKNNKLYGTTGGGANNRGILFEYDLSTETFSKKFDFSAAEPAPMSSEESGPEEWLWIGSELYGISTDRLFKWNPESNVYTTLINFPGFNVMEGLTLVPNVLTGGSNSNWNDPNNWSSGSIPSPTDDVVIPEGVQLNISSNISVGSLTLATGATLVIEDNAQIEIATNFKAAGTVIITGTSPKILPETFSEIQNLIIDNDSTVSLSGQLFVGGTLTVQSGALNLNGYDLNLGYNGTLVEDFDNNHIVLDSTAQDANNPGGAIIAQGRTVSDTPTNLAGLGIALNREAGSNYTVEVIRYHYAGLLGGIPRIYGITGNATGTNTSIRINYTEELIGEIDPANLRMFRYSDEVAPLGWTEVSNPLYSGAVVSAGLGYVEVSNINNFSDWTLADATVALPISLLSFTGKAIDERTAELTWKTASESNNQGFEIQKSNDAQVFEPIGFVEGAGNSTTLRTYTYLDRQAEGINYYRLKQIDFDGKYSYSPIVMVENPSTLEVFPNPFTGELHLKLGGSHTSEEVFTVEITDIQGRSVFQAANTLQQLETQCSKSLQQAASGIYTLTLKGNGKQYIKRLVKE